MSNDVPIGKDCKLYYDEAADWAAPSSPVLIDRAVDVSMPGVGKNMIDLPARDSGGWNLKGAGLKSLDLQFGYLYKLGTDTVHAALLDSYINDTPLAFYVLDGLFAGVSGLAVQGFRFVGVVSEFNKSQELEDGERFEVKADAVRYAHTDGSLRLPAWYTIAALP